MTAKHDNETKKLNLRRQSLRALSTTNLEQVRGGASCKDTHICRISFLTK
jgi:hypothetical protein